MRKLTKGRQRDSLEHMVEEHQQRGLRHWRQRLHLSDEELLLGLGVGEVHALHELGVERVGKERLGQLAQVLLEQAGNHVDLELLDEHHRLPAVCRQKSRLTDGVWLVNQTTIRTKRLIKHVV